LSLSKYEALPDVLHPRVILDIAVRRIPEKFIATEIFPERRVEDVAYKYVEWKPTWTMARSRAELAESRLAEALPYTEKMGKGCVEYSEKFFVSDREVRLATRDTIADRIEAISAMIALRQEYLFINEILTNTDVLSFTGPASATENWGQPDAQVLDDIAEAEQRIEDETGVTPDTIIVNSVAFRNLLKASEVRELVRGAVLEQGLKQSAGRIIPDLDLYKEINKQNTTKLLADDRVIVLKRGVETGAFHVFEPLSTRRWESEDPRGVYVRLWKTLAFDLFDPEKVCVIDTTY